MRAHTHCLALLVRVDAEIDAPSLAAQPLSFGQFELGLLGVTHFFGWTPSRGRAGVSPHYPEALPTRLYGPVYVSSFSWLCRKPYPESAQRRSSPRSEVTPGRRRDFRWARLTKLSRHPRLRRSKRRAGRHTVDTPKERAAELQPFEHSRGFFLCVRLKRTRLSESAGREGGGDRQTGG